MSPIAEALLEAVAMVGAEGGPIDYVYIHPHDWVAFQPWHEQHKLLVNRLMHRTYYGGRKAHRARIRLRRMGL